MPSPRDLIPRLGLPLLLCGGLVILTTGARMPAEALVPSGLGPETGEQDPLLTGKIHPAVHRQAAAAPAPGDSLYVWVWLRDKGVAPGQMQRALASLRYEVSDRALSRRRLRGRITGLVPADLPVFPGYLNQVRTAGLRLRRTSRWLNAAS